MNPPIRIGLIGFGKVGRMMADEILRDPACELAWVIRRSQEGAECFASQLLGHAHAQGIVVPAATAAEDAFWSAPEFRVDVVVDFSDAEAVHFHDRAAAAGARIVSAISHYTAEQAARVRANADKVAVLHSANITVGINFLMVAAEALQKLVPEADIEIVEEHFRGKKGASGTARKLADTLGLDHAEHVNSIRVGGIVGRHEVIFGLPNQTIRLTHESINRAAFARGALLAAKWLAKKPAGLYSMECIVRDNLRDALRSS